MRIISPPPPSVEMLKCAERAVTGNLQSELKSVHFNGKRYTVSVQNGYCLAVNRQDKSSYSSVGDFFARGFTRGQCACYPRALQLRQAINQVLSENSKTSRACPTVSSQSRPVPLPITGLRGGPASAHALANSFAKPAAVRPKTLALDRTVDKKGTEQKFSELKFRLNGINQGIKEKNISASSWLSPEVGRYRDIKALSATAVSRDLHANNILVNGKPVAIASQYPKEDQLKNHLRMLADNRTPCLVVLAGDDEIVQGRLPPYFKEGAGIPVKLVEKEAVLGALREQQEATAFTHRNPQDRLLSDRYELTAADSNGVSVKIPVVHIKNWPDKSTIPLASLDRLVKQIHKLTAAKNASGASAGLPVIHCKAGVGRTGLVIAQYVMSQDSAKKMSLEKIIKDMRESRNGVMVQTDDQIKTLVKQCIREGRAVTEK